MESALTFDTIRRALSLPLPGRSAHLKMSTRPRPGDTPPFDDSKFRDGAVLILIYPLDGELHLPLTKRTTSVASHKGHISFPGGEREGEETLVKTALRESREEIGVIVPDESVIGRLSTLYVPASGYRVAPFVAAIESKPRFRRDPNEVEEIIEVPLRIFLEESSIEREWRTYRKTRILVPFYRYSDHKIWGATAMMVSEFAELIRAVE